MRKDFYVYLHKTLDGRVFYVGKGRGKRAWSKKSRSKQWYKISTQGYLVEMYQENISEKDALELESDLIRITPDIINTKIHTTVSFDDYAEYFIYDPNSPSGLTRTKGILCGRGYSREVGEIGPCGFIETGGDGYKQWVVGFKNKHAKVHRIIWQLFHGEIQHGFVVDHLDGNSLNNNILNLRVVTKAKNSRNSKIDKNNTSGVVGVSLHKTNNGKSSYWRGAYCSLDENRVYKYFSIDKLGHDEAFLMACSWRTEQIRLLNEQGAGYTERHGT